MSFPIAPTHFEENPYKEEWFALDFMYTQDGIKEFPNHHCKETFLVSLPFVRTFGSAIDVGCRDGEYTRFLQHYFSATYAFDARFRKFFPYNVSLSRTTHFTCALGDERGNIEMFGGTHDPKHGKRFEVACLPLDDFGLVNVGYLKIDVEGFELKVLRGAAKLIENCRPLIVIEQNEVRLPAEEPYAAKKWLEARGYHHVATCGRGWDHVMAPSI